MAIDFPSNPTNGQVYANYIYDSSITAWRNVNTDTGIGTLNAMGLKNVVPTSISVGSGSATVNSNGTISFSGVDTLNLRGCYSSTYKNYRMIIKLDRSIVGGYVNMKNLSGVTPSSVSYKTRGIYQTGASTTAVWVDDSGTNGFYLGAGAGDLQIVADITTPFTTNRTNVYAQTVGYLANETVWFIGGWHDSLVSYDGAQIIAQGGGTMTGTLQLFGYTN